MKSHAVFLFSLFSLTTLGLAMLVDAKSHGSSRMSFKHARHVARPHGAPLVRRQKNGHCKPKSTSLTSKATEAYTSAASTNTHTGTSQSSNSQPSSSVVGLIQVTDSKCGSSGATHSITKTSGPNGDISWLNCGISEDNPDSPWTPPYITVNDIVTVSLSDALKDSNSPFHACADYITLFEQYARQYGLPPILIASIALQESSCNPDTVGGAGEQGLMQLTKDKCVNAPDGNCKEPHYNIQTGCQFFSNTLNGLGGDLLRTIGGYNGWPDGMTYNQATAAGKTSCCRCQNNLDYLLQTLDGWVQNHDAYNGNPKLGYYFNLNICPPAGG